MGEYEQVIKFISALGVSGVLIVLVYGLLKGWFVTGREYSTLTGLFATLQHDMAEMRNDQRNLKDRDERQQKEIDQLKDALADEQKLKAQALVKVDALTRENESLRKRVSELEATVGGMGTART